MLPAPTMKLIDLGHATIRVTKRNPGFSYESTIIEICLPSSEDEGRYTPAESASAYLNSEQIKQLIEALKQVPPTTL